MNNGGNKDQGTSPGMKGSAILREITNETREREREQCLSEWNE